jgi:DNA-directed RNA polymerase subunit RPC12/RpoP
MVKAKCSRCSHEWEYSGKAIMATCPSCILKTRVKPFVIDSNLEGDLNTSKVNVELSTTKKVTEVSVETVEKVQDPSQIR